MELFTFRYEIRKKHTN